MKHRLIIEFNEKSRRDYINGLSRRKKERKEKAIHLLKKQIKEERIQERKLRRNQNQEKSNIDNNFFKNKAKLNFFKQINDSDEKEKVFNNPAYFKKKTSQVEKIKITDPFSKDMFGSGEVTITSFKLDKNKAESSDSEDEIKKADTLNTNDTLPSIGYKNAIHITSKAEKSLQKLKQKKNLNLKKISKHFLRRKSTHAKLGKKKTMRKFST